MKFFSSYFDNGFPSLSTFILSSVLESEELKPSNTFLELVMEITEYNFALQRKRIY